MSDYLIQSETLTGIADAIRAKTGDSGLIIPENMAAAIEAISGGGLDTFDTATGEFTLETNLVGASLPITHGLGKAPFVVFVIPKESFTYNVRAHIGGFAGYARGGYFGLGFYAENGTNSHNPNVERSTDYINNFTANTFDIKGSANYPYIANIKHVWVAAAFKD